MTKISKRAAKEMFRSALLEIVEGRTVAQVQMDGFFYASKSAGICNYVMCRSNKNIWLNTTKWSSGYGFYSDYVASLGQFRLNTAAGRHRVTLAAFMLTMLDTNSLKITYDPYCGDWTFS